MRDSWRNTNNKYDDEYSHCYAANGTPIQTYGKRLLTVSLGLRRAFNWNFTVADVTNSIIGADFLEKFGLLIDIKQKRLIDPTTGLSSKGEIVSSFAPQVTAIDTNQKISFLLSEFKELLDDQPSLLVKERANVTHFIETNGPPFACKARRLNPQKLAVAKKEFNELIRLGICRPSKSNYASPLHMAPKSNGDWRPCGDYRKLNSITTPDRYPVPNLKDFTSNLHGKKIFSRIDLRKAYHQVPIEEKDVPKTAIITPFGLFEFVFMAFGLRNASQTFQRLIDEVLRDLDFVFAFIDDIFISSKTYEEHITHVRIVFQRLKDYGLRINAEKCEFAVNEIKFLGHIVTPEGIKPNPEKVEAILSYKEPIVAQDLKRFNMMINFYRDFLPSAASIQMRLQALIIGNKKKDMTVLKWTDDARSAFNEYKQLLASNTLLVHPNNNAKWILSADASTPAIGGVLHQIEDGIKKPLGFFSRKLSDTEMKYPTYDRELLAIYRSIQHFEHLLDGHGHKFEIHTDHKPLSFAFTTQSLKVKNVDARRIAHLHYISQYTTTIIHVPGKDNVVADFLSRIEAIESSETKEIDFNDMAEAQKHDESLKSFMENKTSSLELKPMTLPGTKTQIICDVSGNSVRPFVPNSFRNLVIDKLHRLCHPGINATTKLVQQRYVWPNLRRDCKQFVTHCIPCQRAKVHKHTRSPLTPYETQSDRFEHINIDLVGPLPESQGYTYLLTAIDRATRWTEAIPLRNITADTVAKALIFGWISRFGIPKRISTDQGTQFDAMLFNQLNQLLGCKHLRTTAYNPKSNGMVERWHRSLKASLKAKFTQNWMDELPMILLGLRSVIKDDLKATPAEMTLGKSLILPGQFFIDSKENATDVEFVRNFKRMMSELRPTEPKYHDQPKVFVHPKLPTAKYVFVRIDAHTTPLQAPYMGPFEVIKHGDKFFKLNMNGKIKNVSIDRLKPAFVESHSERTTPSDNQSTVETPSVQPIITTRSGRRVKLPDRLKY